MRRNTRFTVARMLLVAWFLLQTAASGNECRQPAGRTQTATTAQLCEILRSSSRYDGQRVVVFATYRVGFEASELYCLSCSELGGVWVEFDSLEGGEKAARAMDRLLHKKNGTLNGVFTGVFHSAGARSYGHLSSWSYGFSVDSVRDLKLIDHVGLPPKTLGQESRSKVCK
jgi:hypothetical protein